MLAILSDPQALMDLLGTSLRLAIPIIFAAIGGVIAERSGVFNIALEGCILGGAFGAAVGAYAFGSPVAGLACGILVAALAGLILAGLAVGLAINQLVAGIAINILMLGLTSYLARLILGADATSTLPGSCRPSGPRSSSRGCRPSSASARATSSVSRPSPIPPMTSAPGSRVRRRRSSTVSLRSVR